MGDSKQVRVDNWGTYFLQRLQQFFNKTDYCDLTLQFEGNVQLKVHRLVMSACTEYFHVLEQTCEMCDDILIMPPDLQADVILPIVNFMYTGILEFQLSTFDKLYRTAELMNIPVLMKLLDAQRKPVQANNKSSKKSNSVAASPLQTFSQPSKKTVVKTEVPELPATLPGRKLPVWKRKTIAQPVQSTPLTVYESKFKSETSNLFDNAPKPTRFEWPEEETNNTMFNLLTGSFNDISYSSKPLLTQDLEQRALQTASTARFESIKNLPNENKKASNYSEPAIDMEEVKDYVKEQKIRSDLVEEDDEDADNDLESFETVKAGEKRKAEKSDTPVTKRVRFNIKEKENKELKINVTPTGKGELNHTKIISEVLKKYPQLVKKNKNIRLKILAKNPKGGEGKYEINFETKQKSPLADQSKQTFIKQDNKDDGPWECRQCAKNGEPAQFVLYYLFRKHMTEVHQEKFDSRMCKYCGHTSSKHNLLMYHQYTKHGVKPPAMYNFPKCEQCPYIALTETLMLKHKKTHTKYDFECSECKLAFNSSHALQSHMQITAHSGKGGKTNYDCQFCTKRFNNVTTLFNHIKQHHKDEGKRDGVLGVDEPELDELCDLTETEEEAEEKQVGNRKEIKILSNLKLDSSGAKQQISLEPSSEAEALSNVASGIATSLGLVDIVVLDENNQQYILHPNDQQMVSQNLGELYLKFICY